MLGHSLKVGKIQTFWETLYKSLVRFNETVVSGREIHVKNFSVHHEILLFFQNYQKVFSDTDDSQFRQKRFRWKSLAKRFHLKVSNEVSFELIDFFKEFLMKANFGEIPLR